MGVKHSLYQQALDNLKLAREIRDRNGYSTKLYASSIRFDGEQRDRMWALVEEHVIPYVDEWYELPLYSMGSVASEREAELGYKPTAGNQGRIGMLRKPLPCWSAFTEGHVRADSTVSLCCFDADGRFKVGDLKEDDWMDIWHNDKFAEIRKAHLSEDLTNTPCESCVAY